MRATLIPKRTPAELAEQIEGGQMKSAALALAERGLVVFPCWPNRKTPICKHGFKEATTDREVITEWWSNHPSANIAVATGRKSGIFVADIDVKGDRNGEDDLRALGARYGPLPDTVESITPSKGRHLWFRMPEFSVPSSVGKLAPGIDIRGDGGYVLVPPSRVVGAYCWSVDCASEFADAPVWLIALIARGQFKVIEMPKKPDDWLTIVRDGVDEGCRNDRTASLAGYLLRRGIHAKVAFELLLAWDARNKPPLGEAVIERTVVSIAEKEIARRRATPQRPRTTWGRQDNSWKTKR